MIKIYDDCDKTIKDYNETIKSGGEERVLMIHTSTEVKIPFSSIFSVLFTIISCLFLTFNATFSQNNKITNRSPKTTDEFSKKKVK